MREDRMPISFACPNCGKKLKAPDDAVGKSSRCPGCGNTVTCPEPILDAELIDATADEPGFVLDEPLLPGSGAGQDHGLAGAAAVPAPAEEVRRPCPMCGEMIVAGAAKCRFCGEIFDESIRKVRSGRRRADENLTTGDIAVALLCGWIGCFAGIVWMIQGKPKGWKMLALSFVSGVLGMILWNLASQNAPLAR